MDEADSYSVDITLHCFDVDSESLIEAVRLATGIPNSGSAHVTLPKVSSTSNDVGVFTIQVALGTSSGSKMAELVGGVGVWSPIGYSISTISRVTCELWAKSQPPGIGEKLLSLVLKCPPTAQDTRFEQEDGGFFHPGSSSCYRQLVTPAPGSCSPSAQCCYDEPGNLLQKPLGAGTVVEVSPQGGLKCNVEHVLQDVLPWIPCCLLLLPSPDCNLYYDMRPTVPAE